MTCSGCRGTVEKILSTVEGVSNTSVDLEKAEATIEMESQIPMKKLQEAFKKTGGRFTIFNKVE
jgi:Cu2+-exporting ATPase